MCETLVTNKNNDTIRYHKRLIIFCLGRKEKGIFYFVLIPNKMNKHVLFIWASLNDTNIG